MTFQRCYKLISSQGGSRMVHESELAKVKAECDRIFHEFMEANILLTVPNRSQLETETAKENFLKALQNFNDIFKKYEQLQNSQH